MGKKKSFINKKQSVTYNLVYGATEDTDDAPERVLVDAHKGVGIGRVDPEAAAAAAQSAAASGRRYPPNHPLAWLEDEASSGPMSEERRRLNLEFGFPDDGYDYLKHTRTGGAKGPRGALVGPAAVAADGEAGPGPSGSGEAARVDDEPALTGPSVFVPAARLVAPTPDVRTFDASKLWVPKKIEDEDEATQMLGGVTAFTRETGAVRRQAREDINELERLMEQFEDVSDVGDEEGIGDLEEDFVLEATQVLPEEREAAAARHAGWEDGDGESEDEFDEVSSAEAEAFEDADEDGEGDGASGLPWAGLRGSRGGPGSMGGSMGGRLPRVPDCPQGPGSIASTYWRPERTDRKEALTIIDERFEQLALEYDDDDIGDLEEQAGQIAGTVSDPTAAFSHILDDFLSKHGASQGAQESRVQFLQRMANGGEGKNPDKAMATASVVVEDRVEAAAAVAKAKELLALYEEQPETARKQQDEVALYDERPRERWDCESVLSKLTNTDNHPGRIGAPPKARSRATSHAGSTAAGAGPGIIKLSDQGIPLGYAPVVVRQPRDQQQGGAAAPAAPAAAPTTPPGPVASTRRKGESAEDKKARKTAVKEAKRESRVAKKELKQAFKEQSTLQQARVASGGVGVSTIPMA